MPYTNTSTELISIDGVPLNTPAWTVTDSSDLYNGASVRGNDILVAGRRGTVARRRTIDAVEVVLPIVVYGDRGPDGTTNSDPRAGLLANIDTLKRVLHPNGQRTDGTRLLSVTVNGAARTARVHTTTELQLEPLGPSAARGAITLVIPTGVLRGDTISVTYTGAGVRTLTIAGTADVYDATIVIVGTADSARITNRTIDSAGGTYLNYGAAIAGTLTINAATFTAQHAPAAGGSTATVTGNVTTGGTGLWLPLLAGANTLEVTLTNGTPTTTVAITYQPAYT